MHEILYFETWCYILLKYVGESNAFANTNEIPVPL